MSDKIKSQIKPKQYELTNYEFAFLNSMNAVAQSFDYYLKRLQSEYLKMVSTSRLGFPAEANLEFSIDMKSEDHKLTVTELKVASPSHDSK